MKLHTATIRCYRAIDDVTLSFEDVMGEIRPVTVLVGPNGCGKTSALFAIVQALRGVMGYRTADVPAPTALDIHKATSGQTLSDRPISASVTLQLEFEPCELEAIPKIFRETEEPRGDGEADSETPAKPARLPQKGEDIPAGRVKITWAYPPQNREDGTPWPSWRLREIRPWLALPWFKGRQRAIRGWLNGKLSDPELVNEVGGIWLFPQDRNLGQRVVGGSTLGPGRSFLGHEVEEEGGIYEAPEPRVVWGVLERLSSEARYRREESRDERSLEGQIMDIFNRVCAPKKYLGFRYPNGGPTGAPYFEDGDSRYPLHQAASGEQVIIELITRLMYPTPLNHSLILIDEPELHLHPGWVRQVYRALPHIGIGNQYILTTHSAELRAMAAEDGSQIDLGDLQK